MHRHQFVGRGRGDLPTPCLLVDEQRLEGNLAKMSAFFSGGPARLRPHAKSHKCSALARRQVRAGAIGITVATIEEGEAMAAGGVDDILLANEVVSDYWTHRLVALAGKCKLTLAVDAVENARQLSRSAARAGAELGVLVDVDVGMGRCGIASGKPACQLAHQVAALPGLRFRGFMGYEGHAVGIMDRDQRAVRCRQALVGLVSTAEQARREGLPVEIVSAGGTGTYDTAGRIPGVTEIQAGSYALMDAQYRRVLTDFECALTVLATVISRPTPWRAIVDAGLKSMTTEFGLPEVTGRAGVRLRDLSEEHGILEVDGPEIPLAPGDEVELVPTHGCTTVALHPALWVMRERRVAEVWAVDGRRGC